MENNALDKDKELYVVAVMRYKEAHPNIDVNNLFSMEWNLSKNYHLKCIIIAEAILNNILIEDTELYKNNFIEKFK